MGKQVLGLLETMGYRNLRYYVGGMADWAEGGGVVEMTNGPAESVPITSPALVTNSRRLSWLE